MDFNGLFFFLSLATAGECKKQRNIIETSVVFLWVSKIHNFFCSKPYYAKYHCIYFQRFYVEPAAFAASFIYFSDQNLDQRSWRLYFFLNFYVQNFAHQSRLHQIRKPSPIVIFYQFYNFPMHSLVTSSCQLVITSLVNLYPSVIQYLHGWYYIPT